MKATLCPPAIVIYTDRVPRGSAGVANAFVVRIRPDYRDDRGLLVHELEHVRQWWVMPVISDLLYLFSRRYRLWAEVRAYRKQVDVYPPEHREHYVNAAARLLVRKYRLKICLKKAKRLLS